MIYHQMALCVLWHSPDSNFARNSHDINTENVFTFEITPISLMNQRVTSIDTLRPGQNGRHFADDIFKSIFLNENVWIPINISLKFVPKGPINNIRALVQILAWRRPGDKLLSEPMLVSLPTNMSVTRPQWVNVQFTTMVCVIISCCNSNAIAAWVYTPFGVM